MTLFRRWPGLLLAVGAGLLLAIALAWFRPLGARAVSPGLAATIARDGAAPIIAPVGGDGPAVVTIVVFSDYRCAPCRRAHPALVRAVAADGRVRVVAKEWPIFGPRSEAAARVALAADRQGRYAPVNDALMREPRALSAPVLRETVRRAGGDGDRLARDLARYGPAIDNQLRTNAVQAQALGLPGTPAYLAGRWLVVGALDERGFRRLIAKARAD